MEDVQKSGRARSIGVSNFNVTALQALLSIATIKPVINQVEFHPYLQQTALHSFCTKHGITIAAYAPQSPITKARPGPLDSVLDALARKYAVNEGEILLRWCIDKGAVVITQSSKEQRLSDYLRVLAFKLTPREIQEIDDDGSKKHFRAFFVEKFQNDDAQTESGPL